MSRLALNRLTAAVLLTTIGAICNADSVGIRIVTAARAQVGVTTLYVPAYRRMSYPGGDVPQAEGVCTDVVIRALRVALKIDLQKLVHEDMAAHFSKYPNIWGRKTPDPNIDHRRVPNLQMFFKRRGWKLAKNEPYLPGDLVTCNLPRNHVHIMIVSDRRTTQGWYLVIHNIGEGAREEDCLSAFPGTGHYRVKLQY